MPQFDLNYFPSQIFWLIVVFSLMYIVVSKLVAPSAENIFNKRQTISAENIAKAESLTTQADKLKRQYEDDYQQIWLEAKNLHIDNVKKLTATYEERKAALTQKLLEQQKLASASTEAAIINFKANEDDMITCLAKTIIEKINRNNVEEQELLSIYKNLTHKA